MIISIVSFFKMYLLPSDIGFYFIYSLFSSLFFTFQLEIVFAQPEDLLKSL